MLARRVPTCASTWLTQSQRNILPFIASQLRQSSSISKASSSYPTCQHDRRHLATCHLIRHQSTSSSRSTPEHTLAILGGGLSGLSSAFYFIRSLSPAKRARTRIVVYEKQDRVGGWCKAIKQPLKDGKGQLVFETGPRSIRPVGLMGWLTVEMAHTIGLTSHILTVSKSAPSAKNRYLYLGTSASPPLFLLPSSLKSAFLSLFSTQTNLMRRIIPSILKEPFVARSELHSRSDGGDESIDSFFSRRFGPILAERMISAMIHGIYAGDTRKLSVRAVFPGLWEAEREWGSVIKAALFGGVWRKRGWKPKSAYRLGVERETQLMQGIKDRLVEGGDSGKELVEKMSTASVWGIKGGLEELTFALERWLRDQGVEFRLGEATRVDRLEDGTWEITTPSSTLNPSHLITTLPDLLPSSLSPAAIPSTTVSVINLAFPTSPEKSRLFPPGFGYLIPRSVPESENPHRALGVIFDSDVMPGVDSSSPSPTSTSEESLEKVSLLLGGSYWLGLASPPEPKHQELVDATIETLKLHFPDRDWSQGPKYSFSHTHRECIPQVPPFHFLEFRKMGQRLRDERKVRVAVVGGGFASVGVNGAVKAAWEVGEGFAKDLMGEEGKLRTGTEMWEV